MNVLKRVFLCNTQKGGKILTLFLWGCGMGYFDSIYSDDPLPHLAKAVHMYLEDRMDSQRFAAIRNYREARVTGAGEKQLYSKKPAKTGEWRLDLQPLFDKAVMQGSAQKEQPSRKREGCSFVAPCLGS